MIFSREWNSVYVLSRRWAEQGVSDVLLQTLVDLLLRGVLPVIPSCKGCKTPQKTELAARSGAQPHLADAPDAHSIRQDCPVLHEPTQSCRRKALGQVRCQRDLNTRQVVR